uniref:HEPN_RiboL-PSP domain-containing protein n=1 Tax=Rhabditophanes sp. KR3021 TaxID=114890 RepID=A0AC35UFL7_9BILA
MANVEHPAQNPIYSTEFKNEINDLIDKLKAISLQFPINELIDKLKANCIQFLINELIDKSKANCFQFLIDELIDKSKANCFQFPIDELIDKLKANCFQFPINKLIYKFKANCIQFLIDELIDKSKANCFQFPIDELIDKLKANCIQFSIDDHHDLYKKAKKIADKLEENGCQCAPYYDKRCLKMKNTYYPPDAGYLLEISFNKLYSNSENCKKYLNKFKLPKSNNPTTSPMNKDNQNFFIRDGANRSQIIEKCNKLQKEMLTFKFEKDARDARNDSSHDSRLIMDKFRETVRIATKDVINFYENFLEQILDYSKLIN